MIKKIENAKELEVDSPTMDIKTIIERMLNTTGIVDEIYALKKYWKY